MDWWALGVLVFELVVGIPPFHADSPQEIFGFVLVYECVVIVMLLVLVLRLVLVLVLS